ncbi:MAG TPA: hypothetical protein VE961_12160 [Pyrinomonadaceae bacterium]|nr:hypothetical protein [Pyrinomonadaceae bacterium]
MPAKTCDTCGSEMIQKSRWRLLLVGLLFVAAIAGVRLTPLLWGPAIISMLTGAYLIIWATLGRGCWCRTCKKFSLGAW